MIFKKLRKKTLFFEFCCFKKTKKNGGKIKKTAIFWGHVIRNKCFWKHLFLLCYVLFGENK